MLIIQTQEKLNLLYTIYMKFISRKTLRIFVVTKYLSFIEPASKNLSLYYVHYKKF